MHPIALRPISECDLLTADRRLTVEDQPAFIADAAARITGHLTASGASPIGPLRVIYHGMVTEAWTPLTRREADFPQILGAYDALGRFIDDSHLERAGSPAEVYLTSRAEADAEPDRVHLEVVWPVSGS